jgi:DNA-binding NtrC family response regulator
LIWKDPCHDSALAGILAGQRGLVSPQAQALRSGESTARITDGAMQCLMAYDWPGNVRELQNVSERGLILSEGDPIAEQSLPLKFWASGAKHSTASFKDIPSLWPIRR